MVLHIHSVAQWGRLFVITSVEYQPHHWDHYVLKTTNPWHASFCSAAATKGFPVDVTVGERARQRGWWVTDVRPVEQEQSA